MLYICDFHYSSYSACKCRFDLHYFSHINEKAFENNGEVNNLFTSRSTLTDELLSRLVFAELYDLLKD